MKIAFAALSLSLLVGSAEASETARLAQAAEGSYPGALVCDATDGGKPFRGPVTLEITGGKASYSFQTDLGTERGSGAMNGGTLSLVGRGPGRGGYEARYSGGISGRGGLLTGMQTGKSFRRACQISVGLGRG